MRGADEDPEPMTSSIRTGLTVFHMTSGHTSTATVELVRTALAEAAAGRLHPLGQPRRQPDCRSANTRSLRNAK
jgi:hypothetical protein